MGAWLDEEGMKNFLAEHKNRETLEAMTAAKAKLQAEAIRRQYKHCDYRLIVGAAGTGKTHNVKQLPNMQLSGTTGAASRNLGDGIPTWHALLGVGKDEEIESRREIIRQHIEFLQARNIQTVCIDEMSMLKDTVVDVLVEEFKESGIGLIFAGDFAQLGPIPVKGEHRSPWAFQSKYWSIFDSNKKVLTKIWRQENEPFKEALSRLRIGDGGMRTYELLKKAGVQFRNSIDPQVNGIALFCTNKHRALHNEQRMSQLAAYSTTYRVKREGSQLPDWEEFLPISLKIGSKVMITANHKEGGGYAYVNGDVGTIEELRPESAVVKLTREQDKTTYFRYVTVCMTTLENEINKEIVTINYRDQNGNHCVKKIIRGDTIGKITFLPVVPAWAITVHKCQGLTIAPPDLVQVLLNDEMKHDAIVYVACSRVKDPTQLILIGGPEELRKTCQASELVRRAGYLELSSLQVAA